MAFFSKKKAESEFKKYAKNVKEDDVSGVLDKEDAILGKAHGALAKFANYIKLFFSLIKDYANGSYREIPWTSIAAIIGTLLYIFSPLDLIPDFIPGVGLIDDAAVLAICLQGIAKDLNDYEKWKSEHSVEYTIITD
jgi:uncharacterized membrane protein YkvA (DUF1232 family)